MSAIITDIAGRTLPMRNWYFDSTMLSPLTSGTSDITYEELIQSLREKLHHLIQVWCRTLPMRNWYIYILLAILFLYFSSDITYEELIQQSHCRISPCKPRSIFFLCRTLPMRNWYTIFFEYILILFRRTLPMRNWYNQWSNRWLICWQSRWCRTLPMRNWYLLPASTMPTVAIAATGRTLPMRNWYRRISIYEIQSGCPECRTLPMRNWYIPLFLFFVVPVSRYNSVGHYLWGIDTNVRLDGVISSSIRRTLPMRNWYKRQSKKSFPNATCVGHYLWGIDTNSHTTYPNCVKCRTLPMRNWYESKIISFWMNWISRTLPMRNWYLYAMTYVYSLTFHANVGHYLWGIDTFFALFHFNIAFCYLVGHYLWGIDTFRAHKRYCKYIYMHESRTLPMRNWYSLCLPARIRTEIPQSSDITYEELTRVRY